MSATPSNPLPSPGLLGLNQLGSCIPKPVVKGDPMSRPWPAMVAQFTLSVRPMFAQVEELMPLLITPDPGKLRYVAAMLPEGAAAAKAKVSNHPLPLSVVLGLRTVS